MCGEYQCGGVAPYGQRGGVSYSWQVGVGADQIAGSTSSSQVGVGVGQKGGEYHWRGVGPDGQRAGASYSWPVGLVAGQMCGDHQPGGVRGAGWFGGGQ